MRKIFQANLLLRLLFIILFLFCLGTIIIVLPSYALRKHDPAKKSDDPKPTITLKAQLVTTNLQAPLNIAFPGNGDMLIAEQTGKIRLFKNNKLQDSALLDLHSKLIKMKDGYEVRGLLGFTIHPKFSSNRKIYVYYSAPSADPKSDHMDVLAEYTLTADHSKADPNSGRILFTINWPLGGNNGGCLRFGPDGYLYISMGDGGGNGDKHGDIGNGQNMNTWQGKILRIDVNSDSAYTVPKDNPFVNKPGVKPEIWAYGLRNTWRFSFDRATKQLFGSDVGEGIWEEINIITKGANYGWRITEANHCYNPATGCDIKGITMPIAEYNHNNGGVCIIGGYVYNGKQLPAEKGKYFFGDWTGPLYYLQKTGNEWQRGKVALQNYPENLKVTGWGEDSSGELYVLTNPETSPSTKCSIYKIVKN